jgi:DNA-binding NarL/FixJ family response regulator
MARNIKVLIAEDHDVVREGLKILISADPHMEVAGEASNGQAAVRLAEKVRPNVILMDLAMPKGNGLDAARDICRRLPDSKVLVLSAYQDEETIQRVMAVGVSGYLTKHSAADELLAAIREVGEGRSYYGVKVAGQMKARNRQAFASGRAATAVARLTPREQEVLRLIACGQPNKEIAFNLGLSIKTIEKHRQAAMDKLNIHDIAGLTRYAIAKGFVRAPGESAPAASTQGAVAAIRQ